MTRMFINKDGQVYSADMPAAPEDLEKLGPDDHMLGALDTAAKPVWPIEADEAAILKKRIAFGSLLEITDPEPRAPLPGSATYPDEPAEMLPPQNPQVEDAAMNSVLAEQKAAAEAKEVASTSQAPMSRAEQLAAEARAKAKPPVAETSAL